MGRRSHHRKPSSLRIFSKTFFAYMVGSLSVYTNYYISAYIDSHDTIEAFQTALSDTFVYLTPVGGIEDFIIYTILTTIIGYIFIVMTWDSYKYSQSD